MISIIFFQVGVMEVGHLKLQVDALGLIAQSGLLAGEAFGVAWSGIAGGGPFEPFAALAAFLAAAVAPPADCLL